MSEVAFSHCDACGRESRDDAAWVSIEGQIWPAYLLRPLSSTRVDLCSKACVIAFFYEGNGVAHRHEHDGGTGLCACGHLLTAEDGQ